MTDEINVGVLDAVLDFLEDNPLKHRQNQWACGTTGCIAGHGLALFGGRSLYEVEYSMGFSRILYEATTLFGLNTKQADALFVGTSNQHAPEWEAINLGRALVAQSKGELTDAQETVLKRYDLHR